ncbi:hypothetical protein EJB05_52300, partial [Eragrostis curvula]
MEKMQKQLAMRRCPRIASARSEVELELPKKKDCLFVVKKKGTDDQIKLFKVTASIFIDLENLLLPSQQVFQHEQKEAVGSRQMTKEEDLQIRTPATPQETLIIKLRRNNLEL